MAIRALVIAIEDYSVGKGLPNLTGVNEEAAKFINWLIEKKGLTGDAILCCAGPEFVPHVNGKDFQKMLAKLAQAPKPFQGRTAGTTINEIINEISRVNSWPVDSTEELFVFFSGHGFSYMDERLDKKRDLLVAADYPNLAVGGRFCLDVSELKSRLGAALGSRNHYYFVDICRTEAPQDTINFTGTGLALGRSSLGDPNIYSLFSTAQGVMAKTTSQFTANLIDGLSGEGRAKDWVGARLGVVFDRLCRFMRARLKPVDQVVQCMKDDLRETDDIIFELNPKDPKTQTSYRLTIEDADQKDKFGLVVRYQNGREALKEKFSGSTYDFVLPPEDYFIEVTHPKAALVRLTPPVADPDILDGFNSSVTLQFRKQPIEPVERSSRKSRPRAVLPERPASLTVIGADHTEITLKNLQDGGIEVIRPGERASTARLRLGIPKPQKRARLVRGKPGPIVPGMQEPEARFEAVRVVPGRYEIEARERGMVVSKQRVEIKPGAQEKLDLLARSPSALHKSFLKAVSGRATARITEFSETLGPMTNWDSGLWLSLLGASHIVREQNEYHRLGKVPLTSFDDVKQDEAIVYVLAGFETHEGPFRFAVSDGPNVDWQEPQAVKKLENVYEFRAKVPPGSQVLSLKIAGKHPYSYAIHCLPNRATFVVFSEDDLGNIRLHQFILYIQKLKQFLHPYVRQHLEYHQLDLIRTMFLVQSRFAQRQNIETDSDRKTKSDWMALMYSKWLDPIMSVIAAYEIIRRGRAKEMKDSLAIMVTNLRLYFPGLPDTEAIARLLKMPDFQFPKAAPLLLEGVMAFTEVEEIKILQLEPRLLDFDSIWTTWRGAVNDIELSRPKKSATKEAVIEKPTPRRAMARAATGHTKAAAKKSAAKRFAAKKQAGKKAKMTAMKKAARRRK